MWGSSILNKKQWLYICRITFFAGLCIIALFLWFLHKDRGNTLERDKDLAIIYQLSSEIPLESFLDIERSYLLNDQGYELLYKRIISLPEWSITNWKKLKKKGNTRVGQEFFRSKLYGIVTTNSAIVKEKINFLHKNTSHITHYWNNALDTITLFLINADWEDNYKELCITNCAYSLSITKNVDIMNFWNSLQLRGLSEIFDQNFFNDCKRINKFINKPFATDIIPALNKNPMAEAFFRAGMPGLCNNSNFLFEGSVYLYSQHKITLIQNDTTKFPSLTIRDFVLNREGTSGYGLVSIAYDDKCGIIWMVRIEKQDYWQITGIWLDTIW